MELTRIFEFVLLKFGDYTLTAGNLFFAILILIGARILANHIFRSLLKKFFKRRKVERGRQFAILAFIKYIVYTLAVLWALQTVGIKLSLLWGGAAALLVGIGLGLQQIFHDLISGMILLSEGTVEVGDVVSVNGIVGVVKNIGFRTSKVQTRDDISILIPNSKLVSDNVINWSHENTPTRFHVSVGVSYGSDVELVAELLLASVKDNIHILENPAPSIQFKDFGSSSLDFDLLFYTNEYLLTEFIKSELRFRIINLFREHGVQIPFPQRDLWLKNANFITTTENSQHPFVE